MGKKPHAQSTKEERSDHSADIMKDLVARGISGDELTCGSIRLKRILDER